MTNSVLLDGKTRVSTRRLASTMIEAALLANERAGAVRLEVDAAEAGSRNDSRLVVVPGPTPVEWPQASLEGRLVLARRRPVADVVFDWLGTESNDPWPRAIEQGMIMLTVRGRAQLVKARFKGNTYRSASTDTAAPDTSDTSVPPVLDMIAQCRTERPEIWALLEQEIATGFKRRKRKQAKLSSGEEGPSEHVSDPDPWLDERLSDQERFGVGERTPVKAPPAWGYLLIGVYTTGLAWVLLNGTPHPMFAVGTAIVVTVVFGIGCLPIRAVQRMLDRFGQWVWRIAGKKGPMPNMPLTTAQRLASLTVWVPLVTTLIAATRDYVSPRAVILPAALGGFLFLRAYRKRAGDAISRRVLSPEEPRAAATPAPAVGPRPADADSAAAEVVPEARAGSRLTQERAGSPLELRIVTGDKLPEPSTASRARLANVRERAPAIRSLYRRGITMLAGGTVLFAIIAWFGTTRLGWGTFQSDGWFPWITTGLAAATVLAMSRAGAAMMRGSVLTALGKTIVGGGLKASDVEIDEGTASVRPMFLSIVAGAWTLFAILRAASMTSDLDPPYSRVLMLVAIAGVVAFLIWFDRARASIERRFPTRNPQHLLALRVFGSPHLDEFLDLTNGWQWIGTRLRLDGPGTSGSKARDLVNYFAGRVDRSIVEDNAELQAALAEFRERPDSQLRFPVNSVQCSNATWKDALEHMIDRSDVVVMDLATLRQENRGVAYELGRLLARVNLDRIILLVDYATDRDVLREIVDEAWHSMPPDSPNATLSNPVIRAFDMGRPAERQPDESLAEWQQRQARGVDGPRLLGALVDAAQPPRRAGGGEPVADRKLSQWTRFPASRRLRSLRNVALYLFLAYHLLPLACQSNTITP